MADKQSDNKNFFGDKGYLTRLELRQRLRKAPSEIPGTTKRYNTRERVMLEKELFGNHYGRYINREEYKSRLDLLKREKYTIQKIGEKMALERKIKYLESLLH
jgi:IS1 family transposase